MPCHRCSWRDTGCASCGPRVKTADKPTWREFRRSDFFWWLLIMGPLLIATVVILIYAAVTHQSVCWEGYNPNGTYTDCSTPDY